MGKVGVGLQLTSWRPRVPEELVQYHFGDRPNRTRLEGGGLIGAKYDIDIVKRCWISWEISRIKVVV
jgi:hypothetical protein